MNQAQTLQKMMNQTPKKSRQAQAAVSGGNSPSPRVMCITSGKGGVGKTNITANIAFALSKQNKRVLILDADLNLANIDVLLGLSPRYNLQHVFNGEKSLPDVLIKGPGNVMILPGSSGILELSDLTESQKLFFLAEMQALGERIDILLIDTAAGINNNVIYFNLAAQERIVVLTPEPTSLTDAYAMVKVLSSRHDVKKFRVLINFARSEKEAVAVFKKLSAVADRFLTTLSLDYMGYIPYDENLQKAVRSQRLVTDIYPKADVSRKILKLSEQLALEKYEQGLDGNIKFFWQGLMSM